MRFKVGDRVRVVRYDGSKMLDYTNERGVVESISDDYYPINVRMNVPVHGWEEEIFLEEELEFDDPHIFNKIVDEYYGW